MKSLSIAMLLIAPLAQAQQTTVREYTSSAQFGKAIAQIVVRVESSASPAAKTISRKTKSHYEDHAILECESESRVTLGRVSTILTLRNEKNELLAARTNVAPLVLTSVQTDREDPNCEKPMNAEITSVYTTDSILNASIEDNHFEGQMFGRKYASLNVALRGELEVDAKTSADLVLSQLKISGISGFYYVGENENVTADEMEYPSLKQAESVHFVFTETK